MLLAIDVGNTNIAIGAFDGDTLVKEFRLRTVEGRTLDEYEALILPLFERHVGKTITIQRSIISSVVPPITPDIIRVVKNAFGIDSLIVGPGIKTGIAIKTTEPTAVGSDRIVNAVAVREIYGAPSIVVDFGTATSFDVVSKEGNYEGGVIAPGPQISLESLVHKTAKLPRVELSWPKNVVGKNTVSAMQSGAVVGYMCLVDGIIGKIKEEVGEIRYVVGTGGLGKLFSKHSDLITDYDPVLTLKGLKIVAELNR